MATREVKTKLVVEGDADFKNKFTDAGKAVSNQKSALKELSAEYENAMNTQAALTKKIEILKNTQIAQTKVVEEAKSGLKNAQEQYDKYTSQVEDATEKLEDANAELEKLKKTEGEAGIQQDALREKIKEYGAELKEAEEKQKSASEAVEDWTAKENTAEKNLHNTNTELINTKKYLKEAEESTDGYATSIDAEGKKIKKTASNQDELNKKYENTSEALDALVGALAASGIKEKYEEIKDAIVACVDAAANFETAMAKVGTIADTESVSLGELQSEILSLSSETGKAASDLAEATYNAISAGVDTASAVDFVATANKLATGGFTDSTTAVDILTTALNAYGLEVSEVSQVSDYLITTQNLGKTTVDELAASLGKVIPVASTYNVEMDNLSAAMAILTANGIATAESTTYLKTAINELGDSSKTVSQTLVEQTGKTFSQLSSEGYSLGDVMEILAAAVDNDKGKFNELWGSAEAGIAALSILSSGSEKYNEVLKQMQISAGATEKAYAKMADTTEVAEQKLSNAFENLKIAVGSELQEQMEGVYEKGTDLINWATEFVETNEWVVPVVEAVASSLGVLALGVTGVTLAVKVIIPLWKEFTAVMASSEIGVVVLAIGTLITACITLVSALSDSTSEIDAETEAWKEQSAALKEATEAYQEQNAATAQNTKDTTSLVNALKDLISKEDGTVANKEAILSLVDQLNEKMPGLNLVYNEQTKVLNLTNEELERYIENQILKEKYDNATSNYTTIYAQKLEATEALEEAQKKLAVAQEDLNEKVEENSKLNMEWYASVDMNKSYKEVKELQETVDGLQESVDAADSALAAAQYDMNMYTIESANMTDAEREEIDAMMEKAETMKGYLPDYYDEIDAIAALAEEHNEAYNQAQADMDAQIAKIQELKEAYDASYEAAYNSITNQLGLFDEMQIGTSQSIDGMIAGLDSQIEYMNEYAENMRAAMELGVNEGILQQLSDGSEESAAILQEIVNSGEDKIQELNEKFEQVEDGKEEFSTAIAEMETYYNDEMEQMVADTAEAVQNMARYEDAYNSAVQTCNGILKGVDDQWKNVVDKYTALANAAVVAYNQAMVIQSPSKRFKWSAEMTMAGIEVGVDAKQSEVLDKYRNLAKESIDAYNREMQKVEERGNLISYAERIPQVIKEKYIYGDFGGRQTTSNNTTQNFYISTPVKSPSELMRAARLEQRYGLAGA